MTVHELTREQLIELKENYYCTMAAQEGAPVSFGELARIEELVTDAEVFAEYGNTDFSADDFVCLTTSGDPYIDDLVNDLEIECGYPICPAIFAL